jgi:hypothetical protein
MKKLAFIVAVLFFTATTFGQTKTDASKGQQKQAAKTEQAKPAQKSAAVSSTAPVKKDGTPDKRFKENKAAAKTAGPVKKDGTPDMRYKDNKAATPAKK